MRGERNRGERGGCWRERGGGRDKKIRTGEKGGMERREEKKERKREVY